MLVSMLKSKIHRATLTEANVDYIGSLSIDEELMELAGLREYEKIMIANVTNGERLHTYTLRAPRNSRVIGANGAAAHRFGSEIRSSSSHSAIRAAGAGNLPPRLVFVDRLNNPLPGPVVERHAAVLEEA